MLLLLLLRDLSVGFGRKLVSAILDNCLYLAKPSRSPRKFAVALICPSKSAKMGAQVGVPGRVAPEEQEQPESSQKAARRHRAAREHPRSARTSAGEPRSSQRPESRMLQTCGLVSAFWMLETYFLSQSAYAHLNAVIAAVRNHIQ